MLRFGLIALAALVFVPAAADANTTCGASCEAPVQPSALLQNRVQGMQMQDDDELASLDEEGDDYDFNLGLDDGVQDPECHAMKTNTTCVADGCAWVDNKCEEDVDDPEDSDRECSSFETEDGCRAEACKWAGEECVEDGLPDPTGALEEEQQKTELLEHDSSQETKTSDDTKSKLAQESLLMMKVVDLGDTTRWCRRRRFHRRRRMVHRRRRQCWACRRRQSLSGGCSRRRRTAMPSEQEALAIPCAGSGLKLAKGGQDASTFRCKRNGCIPLGNKCNGVKNCGDNSDEVGCKQLDRYHQECWTKGGCKDNGKNSCNWCGKHVGKGMYCCSKGWSYKYKAGHACHQSIFSLAVKGHHCVTKFIADTNPRRTLRATDLPGLAKQAKCCKGPNNACGRSDVDVSSFGSVASGNQVWLHHSWRGAFEIWCDGFRRYNSRKSVRSPGAELDLPASCTGATRITLKCGGHCGGCHFSKSSLTVNPVTTTTITTTTTQGALESTTQAPAPSPDRCYLERTKYHPLNMADQGRSSASTAGECQERCVSVDGCVHFSWWSDGGCHLQDSSASKTSDSDGTAGPKSCSTQPAPSPAATSTTTPNLFGRIDVDQNQKIDRTELEKALGTGKIVEPAAPTSTPTSTSTSTSTAPIPAPAPVGFTLSQAQKDAILQKHNELRASMGASDMMKMVWDDTLAQATQKYSAGSGLLLAQDIQQLGSEVAMASSCPRGHSGNRPSGIGENMAWKWTSNFQLTAQTDFTGSVQSWYDEKKNSGSYKDGGVFEGFGKCMGTCGHYTQVVWANANKLGCGAALCPHSTGMPGYVLVCQYGSSVPGGYGGNMGSATLFTKGSACSKCPANFDQCSGGLCSPVA